MINYIYNGLFVNNIEKNLEYNTVKTAETDCFFKQIKKGTVTGVFCLRIVILYFSLKNATVKNNAFQVLT